MPWWTLQRLKLQLMFDNPEMRIRAARKLGEIKDTRAIKPLIAALKERNCAVRLEAAEALGKIGDVRAAEPLIMSLLKDSDPNVRGAAARALGEIKDERGVKPLLSTLDDINSEVRKATAEAVGKIGDARAVKPLVTRLSDEQREVREKAATSLSLFDWQPTNDLQRAWLLIAREEWDEVVSVGEAAIEPLVFVLKGDDKDDAIRKVIVESLEQIGTQDAKRAVAAYHRREELRQSSVVKERLEKEISALKFDLELAQLRYESAVYSLRSLGQNAAVLVLSRRIQSEILDLELQLRALKVALTYYSAKVELTLKLWSMQEQQADAAADLFSSTPCKEEIDPEVISHIEALKSEGQQVIDAAFSLMSMGLPARAALPALIEAVKNELSGAAKERKELTMTLSSLLSALQKVGAEDSIPVLLEVRKCEIPPVSFAATKLLEGLAPSSGKQSSESNFNQRDSNLDIPPPPPPPPPPLRR